MEKTCKKKQNGTYEKEGIQQYLEKEDFFNDVIKCCSLFNSI